MSIKSERMSANMTQQELSSQLGVSRSTLAMWEIGVNYPRVECLIKMSNIFGCTVDELLKSEEPEGESKSQTSTNLED